MITHSALKRVQVDAQARRHDAGEQHLGLAHRTGGALFQVPNSLFNIAHLLKYMEFGKCCLPGPAALFENI